LLIFIITFPEKGWSLDFLAFGDLRGSIEPCGCDPRTDLGGVKRIAKLIHLDRSLNEQVTVLDLGNHFDLKETKLTQLTQFINQAIMAIKPDVSLLNIREARLIEQGFASIFQKRQFLISNSTKSLASKAVPGKVVETLRVKDAHFFGYTWHPSFGNFFEPWSKDLENKFSKLIKNSGKNVSKILLFSGPDDHLRQFVAKGWFDEIIASNSSDTSQKMDDREKQNPGLLLRLADPQMPVYMVPLGGQGILRGGRMKSLKPKPLPNLLIPEAQTSHFPLNMTQLGNENLFIWLDRSYEQASPLDDLMLAYNQSIASAFLDLAKKRSLDLVDSPFSGAKACEACHPQAYKSWQDSGHSTAYQTLITGNKHQDESCVSCHVLGFEEKGGFASIELSPQFQGVQCENCHGPRKDHIQNPFVKTENKAKEVCVSCHHTPHSPEFDYKKYWQKIDHK
jgi:hypothetical protein